MKKIALFGGPGSGKTTLAAAFVAHMNSQHKPYYHVPEYARSFIDTYGANAIRECGPLIQTKFTSKQEQKELDVPPNVEGFVSDSPLFQAWFYSALYGDNTIPSYIARKDNYKTFLKSINNYTHIFRVVRESDYQDDGCRYQNEEQAKLLEDSMACILKLHGIDFYTVIGPTSERVNTMVEVIYTTEQD